MNRHRRFLAWPLLLLAPLALAATAYRWVDADGVVHFSDRPHPGAQKIELGVTQTYSAPIVPGTPVEAPRHAAGTSDFTYERCDVSAPTDDAVFNAVESVNVSVAVVPAKRSSDRITLLLDGQALPPLAPSSAEYHIAPIDRGTHTVVATVRDAQGTMLCQSPVVTFHVHQPSVFAPASPIRHK